MVESLLTVELEYQRACGRILQIARKLTKAIHGLSKQWCHADYDTTQNLK
jgi:hypothetical protein